MFALILGAPAAALWHRYKSGRGIGYGFVQFVGLAWLIGAAVILSVESKIDGAADTILGAVAGYLFAMRRPRCRPRAAAQSPN